MKHIIYQGIFLILSWALSSEAAFALADVKASVTVRKSTVILGDLFDNLESGNDIWVMNSPAPGHKTTLSTRYLANFTRQHNVYWKNSRNIQNITIIRAGKTVKLSELKYLIEAELDKLNLDNRKKGVTFKQKNTRFYLPQDSTIQDITITAFNLNKPTGNFTATASLPTGNGRNTSVIIRGRVHLVAYIPALKKAMLPGSEITAQDIISIAIPNNNINRYIIRNKSQLIGMTPRRSLNAETPLKLNDLERPTVINRGQIINILYQSGKISIRATGKAIESGGYGDVIPVMNSKSHKKIDAVVISKNQVQVVAANNGLAQLNVRSLY